MSRQSGTASPLSIRASLRRWELFFVFLIWLKKPASWRNRSPPTINWKTIYVVNSMRKRPFSLPKNKFMIGGIMDYFLKNGPSPASFCLFSVFSNKLYNFYYKSMWKSPSCKWSRDSNRWYHESSPITTTPGLIIMDSLITHKLRLKANHSIYGLLCNSYYHFNKH